MEFLIDVPYFAPLQPTPTIEFLIEKRGKREEFKWTIGDDDDTYASLIIQVRFIANHQHGELVPIFYPKYLLVKL